MYIRTILNRTPKPRRIVLGQRHDALSSAVAEKIRFLDAIYESVMQHLPLPIEPHKLLVRPVRKVQHQPPWQRAIFCFRSLAVLRVRNRCRRGSGTGKEVVEKAKRVVPFERDFFKRKPAYVVGYVGIDEKGTKEGVQAG